VNEFYYGKTFWRSQSRIAPHNVYTASERWDKLIIEQEILNTKQIDRWIFSTTTTFSTPSTNQITISFLAPDYVVDWKYNSSTQKYERWQAGAEHRDADGVLITADTVIVQHVKTKVLDEIGRLSMITIGTGPAKVYIYGNKVEGTWVKTDRTSGTKFLDSSGEKIKLKPGKIWIEIANQNTTTNA
jgi:hypothetical protein